MQKRAGCAPVKYPSRKNDATVYRPRFRFQDIDADDSIGDSRKPLKPNEKVDLEDLLGQE